MRVFLGYISVCIVLYSLAVVLAGSVVLHAALVPMHFSLLTPCLVVAVLVCCAHCGASRPTSRAVWYAARYDSDGQWTPKRGHDASPRATWPHGRASRHARHARRSRLWSTADGIQHAADVPGRPTWTTSEYQQRQKAYCSCLRTPEQQSGFADRTAPALVCVLGSSSNLVASRQQ